MTVSWYEFQQDTRGVETTAFTLAAGPHRAGAGGTRLIRQLLALGIADGALEEIAEAAAAWAPHSPAWVAERYKPARLRSDETGLAVEHFLRALGFSWDETRELGTIYRPPSSATADLSSRPLDVAEWPSDAVEPEELIASDHRVALIRIPRLYRPGMTDSELYEATRKWWRINPERHASDYAFAVVNGKVLAVYRIFDWERQESSGRWGFNGVRDSEMEERYVGADVSRYFPRGAANPVTYVNC